MHQPMEIEAADDGQVVARVAGIDVAKASAMTCTRVPHEANRGRRTTKVWTVGADTGSVEELAEYLLDQGIERVVIESTSDYWKPWLYVLAGRGLTVWLVNATQVKNVPGRPKTDKLDAVWLAKLAEKSMVSPSFVPEEPMRHVRDLSRTRFDLVADRTRVRQRMEKLLEDALIKISTVLSDIHGVSGRLMIEALIAGERDPKRLADLAQGRARARLQDLERALRGRFTDHHARLCRLLLDQNDYLTARIAQVTVLLDEAITALPVLSVPGAVDLGTGEITNPDPVASAVQRLCAIPGVGPDSARAVIAEIGLDMSVFGTGRRLCSWAKVAPQTKQSGSRTGRAKIGKGNPYLKAALGQMAMAASKTDSFLGARYRRLVKRMPKAKALAAIQRSILMIVFQLLANPDRPFVDLGADWHDRVIDKQRKTRNHIRQLEALGYKVTITAA